ncbi:MAG: DUF1934 domain-containing protein [Eubacterium sp.]|nr:DUF1934 domain-containing protein [Candidatus Colimonas fimequi]
MKETMVKILASQYNDSVGEDSMEFITEAKLYEKNGALYVIYEESDISGIPGCRTRLKVKDGKVQMKRFGEGAGIGNEIKFEKGKRYTGFYATPMGPIELEVLTNNLETSLTPEGKGELDIDYSISLKGLLEGRNKLNITLM